jgi:hypothetical protein
MTSSVTDFGKTNLKAEGMELTIIKASSLISAELTMDDLYKEIPDMPKHFQARAAEELEDRIKRVEEMRKDLDERITRFDLNRVFVMQEAMKSHLERAPQTLSREKTHQTLDA